ncbi:hypothetical protein QO004_000646 [Rhizobium mesoamericanum]|nr:hypothetical protein [Rhizobium mesoamericanum]
MIDRTENDVSVSDDAVIICRQEHCGGGIADLRGLMFHAKILDVSVGVGRRCVFIVGIAK